mmetsp:Transcript_32814/g.110610  ORF Transcript_32814/g.110610 Transcript_32814/m.110610 type:complete len:354 (-) Transcript_32814:1093-2154(-)
MGQVGLEAVVLEESAVGSLLKVEVHRRRRRPVQSARRLRDAAHARRLVPRVVTGARARGVAARVGAQRGGGVAEGALDHKSCPQHCDLLVRRHAAVAQESRHALRVWVLEHCKVVAQPERRRDGDLGFTILRQDGARPARRDVHLLEEAELGEHVRPQVELQRGEEETAAPRVLGPPRRRPSARVSGRALRPVDERVEVRIDLRGDDESGVERFSQAARRNVVDQRPVDVRLAAVLRRAPARLRVLFDQNSRGNEARHARRRDDGRRDDDVWGRQVRQQHGRRTFALGADGNRQPPPASGKGLCKRHVRNAAGLVVGEPPADGEPLFLIVHRAVAPGVAEALQRRLVETYEVR